jgi:hypothetical protein
MKKLKIRKGDIITIAGKRWFDRINGNTYHSVEIWVNGQETGYIPFRYGYGDHYVQTARTHLSEHYELPIADNDPTWKLRDHGVMVNTTVADVKRKKDL